MFDEFLNEIESLTGNLNGKSIIQCCDDIDLTL